MNVAPSQSNASYAARLSAISGTRALIDAERFDALLALMIERQLISADDAGAMLDRLSCRMIGHVIMQERSEWTLCPAEMVDESIRLQWLAWNCRKFRPGTRG